MKRIFGKCLDRLQVAQNLTLGHLTIFAIPSHPTKIALLKYVDVYCYKNDYSRYVDLDEWKQSVGENRTVNLYHKLALLTDNEAKICLNGVLKGLIALKPQYEALFASENQMQIVIEQITSEVGRSSSSAIDIIKDQDESKAIRLILTEIAENPEINPRLEAWFSTARPKLLEPVTSALVIAGLILILSTDITIEYENQGGRKNLKVKVEKKATSSKILEKFFDFFS